MASIRRNHREEGPFGVIRASDSAFELLRVIRQNYPRDYFTAEQLAGLIDWRPTADSMVEDSMVEDGTVDLIEELVDKGLLSVEPGLPDAIGRTQGIYILTEALENEEPLPEEPPQYADRHERLRVGPSEDYSTRETRIRHQDLLERLDATYQRRWMAPFVVAHDIFSNTETLAVERVSMAMQSLYVDGYLYLDYRPGIMYRRTEKEIPGYVRPIPPKKAAPVTPALPDRHNRIGKGL